MGEKGKEQTAEGIAIRLKKTYDMLMELPKEQLANYIACKIVLEN